MKNKRKKEPVGASRDGQTERGPDMDRRLLQSLIIRNDLEEAKEQIEAKGILRSIAHIKTAFLAFHNLCELERTLKPMYEDHRELSAKFGVFRLRAKFFSYLRNKFTGHLTDDLIDKALECRPEVRTTLNADYNLTLIQLYNFSVLETAINTYVDGCGKHRIFESDTDLLYPPDKNRFEKTLLESIELASDFLSSVEIIMKSGISLLTWWEKDSIELFIKAGQTKFTYLARKSQS